MRENGKKNKEFSAHLAYLGPVHHPSFLLALILSGSILAAQGCSSGSGPECRCLSDEICVDGTCYPRPCQTEVDCPVNYACIDTFCRVKPPCQSDSDCLAGRCVEGKCYPVECDDNQTRVCRTECGTGYEKCTNGVWRGCDAPLPRDEVCGDNADNDCDGDFDEGCKNCSEGESRECRTECGTGIEWCVDNEFRGCTAPIPFQEVCGDNLDNDCDDAIDEDCDGCTQADSAQCATECGTGTERCEDGAWKGCDAPRGHQEVCDGIDNDCDGKTDEELVRDCSTSCGSGLETCIGGEWNTCTASLDCSCGQADEKDHQVCGQCGVRDRICASHSWGEWGSCQEAGDCTPGEEDSTRCGRCGTDRRVCTAQCVFGPWEGCLGEGACMPDQQEREACGACGETRTRTCREDCSWGDWSGCTPLPTKECDLGDEEERDCDLCGIETRQCTDACVWGAWGSCQEMGECEPGAEEGDASACPSGEIRTHTCNFQCQWDSWGACRPGGQCTPYESEDESCGRCGTRSRTCDVDSVWGNWGACLGEGQCAPGEEDSQPCGQCLTQGNCGTGECVAGTQTHTCQPDCEWGSWSLCEDNVDPQEDICGDGLDQDCNGSDMSSPDSFERNNDCSEAAFLGLEPDMARVYASIDVPSDHADFFRFTANDNMTPSEHIKIWVENIPAGVDVDVCLYQGLDNCQSGNYLACSNNSGQGNEYIDWSEGWGDDDGDYYVQVFRYLGNSCSDEYTLTVYGLH